MKKNKKNLYHLNLCCLNMLTVIFLYFILLSNTFNMDYKKSQIQIKSIKPYSNNYCQL